MKQFNNLSFSQGQSLIELLIAVAAISVVLVALVGASSKAVSNQTFSRTQGQATTLAQEQMELIRTYRDRNGYDGLTCPSECNINSSLVKNNGRQTVGGLAIWFTITDPGSCPAGKQATAYAQWTDSHGTHQSSLAGCFTDWRK